MSILSISLSLSKTNQWSKLNRFAELYSYLYNFLQHSMRLLTISYCAAIFRVNVFWAIVFDMVYSMVADFIVQLCRPCRDVGCSARLCGILIQTFISMLHAMLMLESRDINNPDSPTLLLIAKFLFESITVWNSTVCAARTAATLILFVFSSHCRWSRY